MFWDLLRILYLPLLMKVKTNMIVSIRNLVYTMYALSREKSINGLQSPHSFSAKISLL